MKNKVLLFTSHLVYGDSVMAAQMGKEREEEIACGFPYPIGQIYLLGDPSLAILAEGGRGKCSVAMG